MPDESAPARDPKASLEIVDFDRLVHYKVSRPSTPAWIKAYTSAMHDGAFLGLSLHLRGLLFSLMLEYAWAGERLTANPRILGRRIGQRVQWRDLDRLEDAGFIAIRSRVEATEEEGERAA